MVSWIDVVWVGIGEPDGVRADTVRVWTPGWVSDEVSTVKVLVPTE